MLRNQKVTTKQFAKSLHLVMTPKSCAEQTKAAAILPFCLVRCNVFSIFPYVKSHSIGFYVKSDLPAKRMKKGEIPEPEEITREKTPEGERLLAKREQ